MLNANNNRTPQPTEERPGQNPHLHCLFPSFHPHRLPVKGFSRPEGDWPGMSKLQKVGA